MWYEGKKDNLGLVEVEDMQEGSRVMGVWREGGGSLKKKCKYEYVIVLQKYISLYVSFLN